MVEQRTGVDDARDRGRRALERVGALRPSETLSGFQDAACVALGSLEKNDSPRAEFAFVLAQGLTKSINDHTETAKKLNVLTGFLVAATALLALATFFLVKATYALAATPK